MQWRNKKRVGVGVVVLLGIGLGVYFRPGGRAVEAEFHSADGGHAVADYLARVEVGKGLGETYEGRDKRCREAFLPVEKYLESIKDPKVLKRIFYDCNAHGEEWRAKYVSKDPDDIKLPYLFEDAKDVIIHRLGTLATPESARVLVEIALDDHIGLGAGSSEDLSEWIIVQGRWTLPYLKEKASGSSKGKEWGQFLIQQVEEYLKVEITDKAMFFAVVDSKLVTHGIPNALTEIQRNMSRVRRVSVLQEIYRASAGRDVPRGEKADTAYPAVAQFVLFRLAEINSHDSRALLVRLFADATQSGGEPSARVIGYCITRCGKAILPELNSRPEEDPVKKDVMRCIREGRRYASYGEITSEDLVRYLDTFNMDVRDGSVFSPVGRQKIEMFITPVTSPAMLRQLFDVCYQRYVRLQAKQALVPRHYFETMLVILDRLREMKTDQSGKVLVDLFLDPAISTNAGISEFLCKAISECGEVCLPYLKAVDPKSPRKEISERLITAIRQHKVLF